MLLIEMNHLQVKSCRRANTPEHSQTATQQSDFMHCGQAHVQMCAHVSRADVFLHSQQTLVCLLLVSLVGDIG